MPLVDFPGGSPRPAERTIALDPAQVDQPVLLAFDGHDLARPIIVGLLIGAVRPDAEAHVDGRRVVLEGRDEIVLRCGQASITLRRNGRIVVRGTQVETEAEGTNRIKGATVRIN